uniref:Uncharacterized protein n=1 Tax=Romanomermis culicivorax TaxID=13658 RepID=A0A915KW96_ROMCU
MNIDRDADKKRAFSIIDPTLSKSMLHTIMHDKILVLNRIIFYDYKVPNMRYCLYNYANVEHTTKLLGQKMHPSKLPSIKGSKQNTSSLTDGKLEPYDDAHMCAQVIDRALRSNNIISIHHAVKNKIRKLLSKSDSLDIDLICQQNWIKCDGTLELELIKWASRIHIIEKNRSDNKQLA